MKLRTGGWGEFAAFVTIPGEPETRVRWRAPSSWRCDTCGKSPIADCRHAKAIRESHQYDFGPESRRRLWKQGDRA